MGLSRSLTFTITLMPASKVIILVSRLGMPNWCRAHSSVHFSLFKGKLWYHYKTSSVMSYHQRRRRKGWEPSWWYMPRHLCPLLVPGDLAHILPPSPKYSSLPLFPYLLPSAPPLGMSFQGLILIVVREEPLWFLPEKTSVENFALENSWCFICMFHLLDWSSFYIR